MLNRSCPALGTPYLGIFKEIGRVIAKWRIEAGRDKKEAEKAGYTRALQLCPEAERLFLERNGVPLTQKRARVRPADYSMRDKPLAWPYRAVATFLFETGTPLVSEEAAEALLDRARQGEFGMPNVPHTVYVQEFADRDTKQPIGTKVGYTGQWTEQRTRELDSHNKYNLIYTPKWEAQLPSKVFALKLENMLKEELTRLFDPFNGTAEHFIASPEQVIPIARRCHRRCYEEAA